MPNIFGNHMVLQREFATPIWGQASPGETVTVSIGTQRHSTDANANGKWRITLDPMQAGGPYHMTVAGSNTLNFEDVLFGDIWFCSGQSNMAWSVSLSNNAAVEIASANYPQIRLISVPQVGTQEPQENFEGQWTTCSPESVANFSAVGYFFGRRIHQSTGVPIGLVDNAWGGSSVEAWINQETLAASGQFEDLLRYRNAAVKDYTEQVHQQKMDNYQAKLAEWQADKKGRKPRMPRDPRYNQHRPGNIYNGVLYPTIGYGMKGMIWYQGESNSGRPEEYRSLFPFFINETRKLWNQGDFPFYWVQLADFKAESADPQASSWAMLREAQTMTLDAVANSGQAVIIDVGEGRDIHPRDKQSVATRLVRHALANDYGYDLPHQSPRFKSMTAEGNKVRLQFNHIDQGLYSFDVKEPIGFAIAGADKQFLWAQAKITSNGTIEVWNDAIPEPVAVRYGWADNPVINVYDRNGLPLTPFRTDNWAE